MDPGFSMWQVSGQAHERTASSVPASQLKIIDTGGGAYHQHQIDPQATAAIMSEPILLQIHDGKRYLVDESAIQNIDQVPPENLIYMNTTENMGSEGGSLSTTTDEVVPMPLTECELVNGAGSAELRLQSAAEPTADEQQQQQYMECEVTEEVITDDWVQSQGDQECVQVTVDQLGATAVIGATVEDEIPVVPLDQDEYTLSRPFPCDFCSRRFRKKANLNTHIVGHSNSRYFACKLCHTHYQRRIDLLNHLQQHAFSTDDHDEPPFIGEQGAEYDTPMQSQGGHHRTRHSSDEEDMMFGENAGVSYNSQPPMQLISTPTSYGAQELPATHYTTTDSAIANASNSLLSSVPSLPFLLPATGAVASGSGTTGSNVRKPHHSAKPRPPQSAGRSNRTAPTARTYIKQEPSGAPGDDAREVVVVPSVRFPVTDQRKPCVCQQCGMGFAREKALASHSRVHGGDSKIECDVCGETFWNHTLLQGHMRQRHGTPASPTGRFYPQTMRAKRKLHKTPIATHQPVDGGDPGASYCELVLGVQYSCDSCGVIFSQADHLKCHIQQVHGAAVKQELNGGLSSEDTGDGERDEERQDTEWVLERSPKAVHQQQSLDANEKPQRNQHKCQLCGESFQNEHSIRVHLQERHRHQLTSTSCATCGKQCKNPTTLMKHAWDHSRVKAHCCSMCDKTFHHKARLKRHMDSHRNKTVKCEVCGEDFPDGRSLMNHRHSHTKANKFPCHTCGKTFGSRSSQQIHIRIHTGERPYGCRFCWKAFADGGTLRKHERIHTGEKPYGCSVCPKAFNQRVVLREHIRAHHSQVDPTRTAEQLPYFCPVCSVLFGAANEFVQHLIEHSDQNTAMKRKTPTFPRKYKRRRKLKPHELERLQNGRRKKPGAGRLADGNADDEPKSADDDEDDDYDYDDDVDDDQEAANESEHRSDTTTASCNNSFMSLENTDGTLKTPNELFVDYGGTVQKLIASPKFISPFELLADLEPTAVKAGRRQPNVMLDDSGINLLSEVVLVHGASAAATVAGDPDGGPQTLNNNYRDVVESPKKSANRKRVLAKPATSVSRTGPRMIHSQKVRQAALAKQSEAGSSKRSSRGGGKRQPSIGTRNKKGSANIGAASEYVLTQEDVTGHRSNQSSSCNYDDSTSAANEYQQNQRLLSEMSRIERYNSDIVNDLAEILRSPVKTGTASGPPLHILATPTIPHLVSFSATDIGPTNSERLGAATVNVKLERVDDQSGHCADGRRNGKRRPVKSVARLHSSPLRSQRLTRRQLEREVNFLKEAFAASPSPERLTTVGEEAPGDGNPIVQNIKQETATNASEKLAEMLLNDQIPTTSSSSSSTDNGHHNSLSAQPEERPWKVNRFQVLKKDGDDDVCDSGDTEEETDDGGNAGQQTGSIRSADYRCSICGQYFDNRAQLLLHVPVHI